MDPNMWISLRQHDHLQLISEACAHHYLKNEQKTTGSKELHIYNGTNNEATKFSKCFLSYFLIPARNGIVAHIFLVGKKYVVFVSFKTNPTTAFPNPLRLATTPAHSTNAFPGVSRRKTRVIKSVDGSEK
jgi:hypothetical protein